MKLKSQTFLHLVIKQEQETSQCNINFQTILNFEYINISSTNQPNKMIFTKATQTTLVFHKIHFSLAKRVKFGQAVFVSGNIQELGLWDPSKAYRLKWNEGDIWSGSILLSAQSPSNIEYKYTINDWNFPNNRNVQWQIGTHNREVELCTPKTTIICDDKWNMDRITLTLHVKKLKANIEEMFYVVGDIVELGNWQEKKVMKKVCKKYRVVGKKQNSDSSSHSQGQQNFYSYTFYTYRGKSEFHYYYIKKGATIESERRPGRIFNFKNKKCIHPYRKDVIHHRGQINIIDQCNIHQLIFSQITSHIFVGSYPKSSMDIQKLKDNRISAIFSIQSQRDFKKHGLTPHYLSLICQQYGIKYRKYSILDMNNGDFINKAEGGLKIMRELIKQGERVYVHCTAGIYRSPQMIALYLTLFEKYTLDQAVAIIKNNHPHAQPNFKTIKQAIGVMRFNRENKKISI